MVFDDEKTIFQKWETSYVLSFIIHFEGNQTWLRIIGRKSKQSFWNEYWLNGRKLSSFITIPTYRNHTKDYSVGDFQQDGRCNLTDQFIADFPVAATEILNVQISDEDEDAIFWEGAANGIIIVKESYNFYRHKNTEVLWKKKLWNDFTPPRISILAWKITQNRLPTADALYRRSILPSSVCINCITGSVEDMNHIMLQCNIAENIWRWLAPLLEVNFSNFSTVNEIIRWAARQNFRDTAGQLRLSCILHGIWEIWRCRNLTIFERKLTTKQ